jgi:thiol-disulfide isomerase/thioredoxin
MRQIDLKPAAHDVVAFEPAPLDANAWRGKCTATVRLTPAGDRPLGGESFRVSYTLPKYGRLLVASGKLTGDGQISLENIAPSGKEPFDGEYAVEVAEEYVGKFSVKNSPERQTVSFRMPPLAGDPAPASNAEDLETSRLVRVTDFRGKVVFLEFWATWCGPCREPMSRLADLAKRRGPSWRDDVALVAVGVDNDREHLRRYVSQNGLSTVRQVWSPENQARKVPSAYADYVISGVPTAFLIGRDGRIFWRGHPASINLETKIDELIGRKDVRK